MEEKAVVLYIDDEYLNLSSFEILFRNMFTIFATHSPQEAIEVVRNEKVDVVITDQKMPVMTGVKLLKKIVEIDGTILRIIHSGYIDDPEIKTAVEEGLAQHILDKPLNKIAMMKIINDYMSTET